MDTTEEPWELFDLEADLQVTLSEDGKEYLRQFGLEQYDFENYQPDDDPGKYFQDVPLEQNPEALFDLLTRESFRDNSNRRVSASTAPPRHGGQRSSARGESAGNKHRHDVTASGQRSRKADVSPTYHSIDVDVDQGGGVSSPKSPQPKRVSFTTENGFPPNASNSKHADKENKPAEAAESSSSTSRYSRSVTNFFGRPKVKQKKLDSKARDQTTHAEVHRLPPGRRPEDDIPDGMGTNSIEVDTKSSKKNRKFKFPVLDLMGRTKRNNNTGSSNKHPPTRMEQPDNSSRHPVLEAGSVSGSGSPLRYGVEKVDLLEGSPELSASRDGGFPKERSSNHGTQRDRVILTDSDSDTYATARAPDPPIRANTHATELPVLAGRGSDGAAVGLKAERDVKVVEVVSCRVPEQSSAAEEQNGRPEDAPGLRATEHLPPGLLAAVTGDINLLRESISHLSQDSLNKLRDAAGNTVLHACAAGGHLTCTEFICRYCPLLVTSENKAHLTPTAMAIKHGQIEVLDWLLDNMNLRQELCPAHTRRRSLLHHAAKFGQDGCLRLLLSRMEGAGILQDVRDQSGNTPAHIAAKYGHLLCLQSLVEYGMDVCLPNQHGHTACYYADFNNHRHCAGYLMVVETCATLARKHVTQDAHADWLITRNDAISGFTTEALSLSGTIARQSSDDVDVTYRLQQTLDDAMDLVGDMASQLNHLYELSCHLQAEVDTRLQQKGEEGRRLSSPGKDDLRVSMERATELQRRLEELDQAVNHQTSRQQLVKVKDVQKRWEMEVSEKWREADDTDKEARQLTRKLFSEAVQRLLVYRTDDRTSRQGAPPSTQTHHQGLPAGASVSRQGAPPATQTHHLGSPAASASVSPQGAALASPAAAHRMEPSSPEALGKLSPRARVEASSFNIPPGASGSYRPAEGNVRIACGKSTFNPSNPPPFSRGNVDSELRQSLTSRLLPVSGGPHEASGSSRDSSFTSNEDSDHLPGLIRPPQNVKNNVVESFLKSRVFYQRDPVSLGATPPKGPPSGLFYSSNQRPGASQLTTPDSLGLQFSEFSAFNRVANRPALDSNRPSERSTELPQVSLGALGHSSSSFSSSFEQGIPRRGHSYERVEGIMKPPEEKVTGVSLVNGGGHQSSRPKPTEDNRTIGNVFNLGSKQKKERPDQKGLVHKLASRLEDPDIPTQRGTREKERKTIAPGVYIDSEESEETISEPTIPPPPLPPLPAAPPPIHNPTKPKPPIPNKPTHLAMMSSARDRSVASSSDNSSATKDDYDDDDEDEEEDEEDDLSGMDLGAELDGDDLMLEPRTFLDDEVDELEGDEEYVDDMFSPEELLALAPRGALPLSMQFETSLSTIEEVSVVSESTRADDNATDAESQHEEGAESDDTVTQPSDHEADLHNDLDDLDLKRQVPSSSPLLPPLTSANGDKPWYETSDDDESSPARARPPQPPAADRPDHFTLF